MLKKTKIYFSIFALIGFGFRQMKYVFMKNSSLVFFLLLLMNCQSNSETKLTIAVAANLQFVINELTTEFTQSTNIPTQTIISSSGKLTAQIQEGAPYDLFLSADMKYPNELHQQKLTPEAPKVYAKGQLVLWNYTKRIPKGEATTELYVNTLLKDEVRHIALANPKTAPYGQAAIQVLKVQNIYDTLKDKLVFGESIAQTNQFIISGAAEMGFTAKSVVLSPNVKGKGHWVDLNPSQYDPIEQGVVILNNRDHHLAEAEKFYTFLFSESARKILTAYGYLVE